VGGKTDETMVSNDIERIRMRKSPTCTPRRFLARYVPTTVHLLGSFEYVFATLTLKSLNTPEKNSKFASCTVSILISSQSSTTICWFWALHGESRYRSFLDERIPDAPRADLWVACTRAEQSRDAKLKRSVRGTRKWGAIQVSSGDGEKESSSIEREAEDPMFEGDPEDGECGAFP
jgi:hypothetical protein